MKKKRELIVIILLIVVILGLIGYILVSNKNNNSEKTDNKVLSNEEDELAYLDIYSDQIQTLYNNIHNVSDCGIKDSNLLGGTYGLYSNGSLSLDNLEKMGFYIGYTMLVEEKGTANASGIKQLKSFTYEEINQKAKVVFGKDYNIEEKEYSLCPVYNYDSSTKTYTLDPNDGCGCTTGPEGPIITLYQATQIGNQINVYTSVVYSKYNENAYYTYYKDPLYNQEIKDGCSNNFSSKTCVDNSTKYKFTYEKEEENYILTNVTKEA